MVRLIGLPPASALQPELREVGLLLGLDGGLALAVEVDVEVQLPVHPGLHRLAEHGQGVALPDRQVGVLALVDRADPVVDAELDGGVQGHQPQRLLLVEPPHFMALAASWFRWRISSPESELIETSTPRSAIRAALWGMAS